MCAWHNYGQDYQRPHYLEGFSHFHPEVAPLDDSVGGVVVEELKALAAGLRQVALLPVDDLVERVGVGVGGRREVVDQPRRHAVIGVVI